MKKLFDILNVLYQIHRIYNDGEIHTASELSAKTGTNERHIRRYIQMLRKMNPELVTRFSKGYRYKTVPQTLEITESMVYSEIAKKKALEDRKVKMAIGYKKHMEKKYPSLNRVLIPKP